MPQRTVSFSGLENQALKTLEPRLVRPITPPEEETLLVEQAPDKDDQILPGGPLLLEGRDGRMSTYLAMVLACALTLWWQLWRPR